jgi:hypothetical protein
MQPEKIIDFLPHTCNNFLERRTQEDVPRKERRKISAFALHSFCTTAEEQRKMSGNYF